MGKSGPEDKSFEIPKKLVWEAWKKVKANKGAAGVDRQAVADFEKDVRGNLYKIWNRMSSGTYFPPPVLAVEIPKNGGGTRTLGVPTVADRVLSGIPTADERRGGRQRQCLRSVDLRLGVRAGGRRRQVAGLVENRADGDDDGPPACVSWWTVGGRAVLMHGGIVGDGRG